MWSWFLLESPSLESISLLIASWSCVIAIIALIYTVKTFYLKSWDKFRYWYSIWTTDKGNSYIHSITIENQKDRALVIYNIFLKIWNNLYFEIENAEDKPIVIKPFEVYQQDYTPALFYTEGLTRYNSENLLKSKIHKREIFLETTTNNPRYTTLMKALRSDCVALFRPLRVFYDGKSYWYNTIYLVDCIFSNGDKSIRSFKEYERQSTNKSWFNRKLNITYSYYALQSRSSLEDFINYHIANGNWVFWSIKLVSVSVVDRHEYVDDSLWDDFRNQPKEISPINRFYFYCLCPIISKFRRLKSKRRNYRLGRKNNKLKKLAVE